MIKKLTLSLLLINSLSYAIEIWKADMAVTEITNKISNGNKYTCSASISNHGDDDAHTTKVLIMLPLDTKYIDFNVTEFENTSSILQDTNCSKNIQHNTQVQSSYVECTLNSLQVDANISIEINANFLDANRTRKSNTCSAFVFSISPDGDLTNNYKTSQ